MHKSSSRRSNRRDEKGYKDYEKKEGRSKSCSRNTTSSHPATGFYPSEDSESSSTYSTSTHKYSKKTIVEENNSTAYSENDDYDSTDEYQVTFPTVELKLPRHRRRHRSKSRPAESHEHVTVRKHVDRTKVYEDLDSKSTVSEYTSYSYSTHPERSSLDPRTDRTSASHTSRGSVATDVTYQTYNSQHRLQSIGNFFTSIFDFFRNNPKVTKVLFGIILCYVFVCNLEVLVPRFIALIVRLCYPWARYSAVVAEQFFGMIANIFTRMDAVIYASYCEFAAKYCRSRRLMCDVTCSFVDHVLSQSRPNLAPIPQN